MSNFEYLVSDNLNMQIVSFYIFQNKVFLNVNEQRSRFIEDDIVFKRF